MVGFLLPGLQGWVLAYVEGIMVHVVSVKYVPELVSQGGDISALPRPVEQHVGMVVRGDTGAERAAALTWPGGTIDPVLVDEAADDAGELRRERCIGVADDAGGLVPSNGTLGGRYRR